MRAALQRFLGHQAGSAVIEYGLIAAIISVATLTALLSMGEDFGAVFGAVAGRFG